MGISIAPGCDPKLYLRDLLFPGRGSQRNLERQSTISLGPEQQAASDSECLYWATTLHWGDQHWPQVQYPSRTLKGCKKNLCGSA